MSLFPGDSEDIAHWIRLTLTPGVGPAPVRGAGSGIFFHVGKPGYEYRPSEGCVQLVRVEDMRWLLLWLDPAARPRILLNR